MDDIREDCRNSDAEAFAAGLADPRAILAAVADVATLRRFITEGPRKSHQRTSRSR